MGLRLKRSVSEVTETPAPSKLAGMHSDDLYLFLESTLMGAQQRLAQYRTAPAADKEALLTWLASELAHASLGVQEMRQRS